MTTTSADEPALASAWPWRVVVFALAGLLVAVVVASLGALALTLSVSQVAERTLTQDVAFEDEAEDVYVAVRDLERVQQSLVLAGPSRAGLDDHRAAVAAVREELGELGALDLGVPDLVAPATLRDLLETYDRDLEAAIAAGDPDPEVVDAALDQGVARLAELERLAASLDAVGTARAADALRDLGQTTLIASTVLVGILVAVVVVGVALTWLAARVLRELRRLTAAEQRSAASLADLLRARTDFIADASHELRTPLTVLRGNADLGARLPPDDCAHVPVLREISSEAVRMGRLVEELLFLARHDAGDLLAQPREVELEALAADIAARAEGLCRQRGIRLETRLAAEGTAYLDSDRIEQAALILVDNASTHSPPDRPVVLGVRREASQLVVSVEDQGPGIPPEILPTIFDRFRRAERTRRGQEGAGLGLAIALAIAKDHGGSIEPGSGPDGGTRMVLRMPLRQPAASANR